MKVRRESVQTQSETGTRRREALRLPVTAAYPRLQQKRHESCGAGSGK